MNYKTVSVRIGTEYINPLTGVIAKAKSCSFDRVTLQDTTTNKFFGKQFTIFNNEFTSDWRELLIDN